MPNPFPGLTKSQVLAAVAEALGLPDISALVLSGGIEGDVVTQQADGSFAPQAPSGGGGGAGAFSELSDVDLTTPPTDGQAPIYDQTSEKWVAGDVPIQGGDTAGIALMATENDYLQATFQLGLQGGGTLEDVTSGGSAAASATYSTYYPANAFDNNFGTRWHSGVPYGTLYYNLPAPKQIGSYLVGGYITASNECPRNWTLEYYYYGQWIVVDTRTNQNPGGAGTTYVLDKPIFASYWRINVSATNGSNLTIGELQLIEEVVDGEKIAQSVSAMEGHVTGIRLSANKEGSPTGTISVRLETDNDGDPSGTLVAPGATMTVDEANIGISEGALEVVFPRPVYVAGGTYWIVIETDRTFDADNYIKFYGDANENYGGGVVKLLNSAVWEMPGADLLFALVEIPLYTPLAVDSVSNPPTSTELVAAFGSAAQNKSLMYILDSAGANTTVWLVGSNGASFWYVPMTKAV